MPALKHRNLRMEEQSGDKGTPESTTSLGKPSAVRCLFGKPTEADRQDTQEKIEELNRSAAEALSNYELLEVIKTIPAPQKPTQPEPANDPDIESQPQDQMEVEPVIVPEGGKLR